jgi:propanol-preferring alcohol dehydrogenase
MERWEKDATCAYGKGDEFRTSIATIGGGELSISGSNVGTRLDLAEAVDMATRGHVKAKITTVPLESINAPLENMRRGKIVGRMALDMNM